MLLAYIYSPIENANAGQSCAALRQIRQRDYRFKWHQGERKGRRIGREATSQAKRVGIYPKPEWIDEHFAIGKINFRLQVTQLRPRWLRQKLGIKNLDGSVDHRRLHGVGK